MNWTPFPHFDRSGCIILSDRSFELIVVEEALGGDLEDDGVGSHRQRRERRLDVFDFLWKARALCPLRAE